MYDYAYLFQQVRYLIGDTSHGCRIFFSQPVRRSGTTLEACFVRQRKKERKNKGIPVERYRRILAPMKKRTRAEIYDDIYKVTVFLPFFFSFPLYCNSAIGNISRCDAEF